MTQPEVVMRFVDQAELASHYSNDLAHGRALASASCELAVFDRCLLTLEHPRTQARFSIPCEVVMVIREGTTPGVALQFADRTEALFQRLSAFVGGEGTACHSSTPEGDDETEDSDPLSPRPELSSAQRAIVEARASKLRNLNPLERMQVARGSVLEDRVLLERIYGSAVWELLLRNPKITVPEVARMARKGTMPRPLLDVIADNDQWIRHSLVRRALLSNPRLGPDAVVRVLRTLPPRELKLVPQQTAYPNTVRQAATRLMRGG